MREREQSELDVLVARVLQLESALADQEEARRRQQAEYAVNRILAETTDPDVAIPKLLQALGELLARPYCAYWEPDLEGQVLRCRAVWYEVEQLLTAFEGSSRTTPLPAGAGLPGRVWASGEPAWVTRLEADSSVPLAREATAAGLRGGLAIPVQGPSGMVGVIECLAYHIEEHDEGLLQTLTVAGNQIGQFIERTRAEQRVHAEQALKAAILENAVDGVILVDADGRVVDFNPAAEQIFGYERATARGQDLWKLIVPPALQDAHRAGLTKFVETGEASMVGRRMELTAMRSDGSLIAVELTIASVPGADGTRLFAGIVHDITERLQIEEALRARARQQETIAELGHEALRGVTFSQLAASAAERVARTLQAEYGTVLQLLPDNSRFLLCGSYGWEAGTPEETVFVPDAYSQAAATASLGSPTIVADFAHETRFRAAAPLMQRGARSSIVVPIPGRGQQAWGVLAIYSRKPAAFIDDDVHFLQSVANLLASAVQSGRTS